MYNTIHTPTSSAISYVECNPVHHTLTIAFKRAEGSSAYCYSHVTPSLFLQMKQVHSEGGSVGKFYNRMVKTHLNTFVTTNHATC